VRRQVALGILVKALNDLDPILRLAAAAAPGRAADPRLAPSRFQHCQINRVWMK